MLANLPDSVDDGQQVRHNGRVDALVGGLQLDVVEGQEHAPEEEKPGEDNADEGGLLQGPRVVEEVERLPARGQAGLDGGAGETAEREEHESDDPHGPRKADLWD